MPASTLHAPPAFRAGWFLVLFVAVYGVLHTLYFWVPDRVLRDVVHYYGIVRPGAEVIRMAAPHEAVEAVQGTLRSPRATLNIVRGCDGAGVAFLLVAAVVAFGATWRQRALGALGAVLLTYLLNQVRIVALYFVAAYRHDWFEVLHNYFIPTFIIVACCIFFAWWAGWAARARSPAAPA
jgi:exosortase family protein XrtM